MITSTWRTPRAARRGCWATTGARPPPTSSCQACTGTVQYSTVQYSTVEPAQGGPAQDHPPQPAGRGLLRGGRGADQAHAVQQDELPEENHEHQMQT